jgi:PTS system mannitol-specific IIC component
MNPRLILAVILGGMTGVFTLTLFNAGLVSPASPGSIFAVLLMTPKASLIGVALSIIASTLVSFLTASMLLKRVRVGDEESNGLSEATRRMQALKQQSKSGGKTSGEQPLPAPALDLSKDLQHVRKIIVACDAGMGSSALGAGVLRKKVKDAGLTHISVSNCAINSLPDDVDLVITHQDLTERAMRHAPQAMHISLSNFLDSGLYTDLTTRLLAAKCLQQPTITV